VNEDAEYHEAGDEGEAKVLPVADAEVAPAHKPVSEDQAAALNSMRDVPKRLGGAPEDKEVA
jgi:hypothetical protein